MESQEMPRTGSTDLPAADSEILMRIRQLHSYTTRDLDRATAEILNSVEGLKNSGALTPEQAQQLMYDVRNERSRINR